MKRKHYSGNWSKVTLEILTMPSHITRNGLKKEKFNCYQCNFTFARIRLVLYTHDEKTLQRQLEQSHIGNLDQAKPCDKKWPEAREIYMLSVQFYILLYTHEETTSPEVSWTSL